VSFLFLLSVVGLAAFALASVGATALVVFAQRAGGYTDDLRPLLVRLLPTMAGTTAALLAISAFVAFEPWHAGRPGPVLLLFAVMGFGLVLRGAVRGALALRANRALAFGDAEPYAAPACELPAFMVTHAFPVVALVGVRAPRIVLARQVVAALDPRELAAVIRHEIAHWRRRDNLTALLLRALPDLLSLRPAGRRLEAAWAGAAERAADAQAVHDDHASRVELAAALVKVARLAPVGQGLALPVAAFHAGAPLATRVAALLESPAGHPHRSSRSLALAVALGLLSLPALVLGSTDALGAIHSATEWMVHVLR
jgi:Zn-dependent protease with chaperone function